MIDIGGSHGLYAVAVCRRHPRLAATVLDLPAAVERAAPLLAQEEMGDRVVHRAGNALTEDLGENAWDLVFVSQLVHHFDDATNRELARRIARALRPDGVFAILEFVRPRSPERAGQTGGLLDLFFAVTSESGTWSIEELREWQQEAGLVPRKSIGLLSAPGARIQAATKPGSSGARSRRLRSAISSSRTAGGSRLAGPQHEASSGGAL
jgi:SAM-dependent methyltransferase